MASPVLVKLCSGLPLSPLPENLDRTPSIAHAAKRKISLTPDERKVGKNLLEHETGDVFKTVVFFY